MTQYQSWGRYPEAKPSATQPVLWRSDKVNFRSFDKPVLPYCFGRTYGDSCLNDGGELLETRHLDRFIDLDEKNGVLRCEAGASLAEILKLIVPRGWFIPV